MCSTPTTIVSEQTLYSPLVAVAGLSTTSPAGKEGPFSYAADAQHRYPNRGDTMKKIPFLPAVTLCPKCAKPMPLEDVSLSETPTAFVQCKACDYRVEIELPTMAIVE